jgi:hypothetical protein
MSEITKEIIKAEFKKYNLFTIQEFIKSLLPPLHIGNKYKYVSIKTLEGFSLSVWGISLQDLLNKFQRFIKLRIFI